MTSPLQRLPRLGAELGVDLRTKRDDLLPAPGGGNKVRKLRPILEAAAEQGCDALVTTGALQSNHARATALAAAERGWRCRLVLHGDADRAAMPTGNLLLMRLAGAEIEVAAPDRIAERLAAGVAQLRSEERRPYLIPGGGHCLAGALACAEAIPEVREQCLPDGWTPDYLLVASGTGATQAGLCVGCERVGWPTRVLGISVARLNPRGGAVVEEARAELREHLGLSGTAPGPVEFLDDWVGEGYGAAGPGVLAAIRWAARQEGLPLDPTYTGKAFAALRDLIAAGRIEPGARVLFWHTGGLLNLLAAEGLEPGAAP